MQPHKSGANMKTSTEKRQNNALFGSTQIVEYILLQSSLFQSPNTLYCGPAFTIHQPQIVESHKLPQPSFPPVCVLPPPHNPGIQTTSRLLQSTFQQSTIQSGSKKGLSVLGCLLMVQEQYEIVTKLALLKQTQISCAKRRSREICKAQGRLY